MALTKTVQLSFAGGEISPDMYGRKDDTRYQNGLARCRNFICLPQGPIRNRPGFEFVSECGIENKPVRVIPFTYSAGQTMIVELGDKYAKFHSYGATLIDDDESHYQIETPWAAEDLFDLVYVQSGDIVTFTSEKYPPTELRRYGARDWRIQTVQINTKLATPTGVKAERVTEASDDPNKDKYTMKYRVSCLNADKTEESEASGIVEVVANLYSYGTTVKISCNTVERPFIVFTKIRVACTVISATRKHQKSLTTTSRRKPMSPSGDLMILLLIQTTPELLVTTSNGAFSEALLQIPSAC